MIYVIWILVIIGTINLAFFATLVLREEKLTLFELLIGLSGVFVPIWNVVFLCLSFREVFKDDVVIWRKKHR